MNWPSHTPVRYTKISVTLIKKWHSKISCKIKRIREQKSHKAGKSLSWEFQILKSWLCSVPIRSSLSNSGKSATYRKPQNLMIITIVPSDRRTETRPHLKQRYFLMLCQLKAIIWLKNRSKLPHQIHLQKRIWHSKVSLPMTYPWSLRSSHSHWRPGMPMSLWTISPARPPMQ